MAPSPRSVAASLARALSLVAPAAADAVLCLCIADIWLLFAGAGAVDIERIAGAEHLAVAVAASKVVAFCESYVLRALVLIAVLFVHRLDKDDADEVTKLLARVVVGQHNGSRVPSRRLEAGWKEVRCDTVVFGSYACMAFILLMTVGDQLLLMKGPRNEAIGSVIRAVGHLGKNALLCFVIVPTAALKVWRVTQPGWRSDSTFGPVNISDFTTTFTTVGRQRGEMVYKEPKILEQEKKFLKLRHKEWKF